MKRTAFTLVEMLIVIAVIIILVGMLLGALSIITKSQAKAETAHLINQITVAMTMYEDKYGPPRTSGGLGDDKCIRYLVKEPQLRGEAPFLELQGKFWADNGGNPTNPNSATGTPNKILDAFTDTLKFERYTLNSAGQITGTATAADWSGLASVSVGAVTYFPLVDGCVIRSLSGTNDPATGNDVVYVYTKAAGWKRQQ